MSPNDLKQKIRAFLFGRKNRELFIFCFFILLSTAFWLMQTLHEEYETEVEIPIVLTDIPDNIVITTELPPAIRVGIKDKGTTIIQYYYAGNYKPIEIPFSSHNSGRNGHVAIRTSDLQKKIISRLATSTRLTSIRPDTLNYYFSHGKKKRLPVRLTGRVEASPGYYLSSTHLNPEVVTVYAQDQILDTIQIAPTAEVHFSDIKDTIRFEVEMKRIPGVKFIPNKVKGMITGDICTEKDVEVPITGINFPASMKLRTFPSKVHITFQMGVKEYNNISAEDFVLSVTYEELKSLSSNKFSPRLKSLPRGVKNPRITPSSVEFLIEEKHADDHD